VLNTLEHHIEVMWLEDAYRRTRKDAAADADRMTAPSTPGCILN